MPRLDGQLYIHINVTNINIFLMNIMSILRRMFYVVIDINI
jgi:hypothetical protein